jgi:hypothetical protein
MKDPGCHRCGGHQADSNEIAALDRVCVLRLAGKSVSV